MSKESLEVIAKLSNSKLQVKEIEEWLLLTYDLPCTPEGDMARREFLFEASAVGAIRQNDSVYLMPWSPAAEFLALKLAKVGVGIVIVWSGCRLADPTLKDQIIRAYDRKLETTLDEIGERIDRQVEYEKKGYWKRALRMYPKTEKLLDDIDAAIRRRGSQPLMIYLELLQKRFAQL